MIKKHFVLWIVCLGGCSLITSPAFSSYLTFVSEVNYRFLPKWNIHLKGFYDRASVYKKNGAFEEGNYLSSWGYQGGMEFFPMGDRNMHLFLNATGKTYKDIHIKNMASPKDQFRISAGFVYRLPIL